MTDEIHTENDGTNTLPDPVEEELEIDEAGVPDPEDEFLEPEDTNYTDPDV